MGATWDYTKPYPRNANPPNVALPRTLYAPAHHEGFYNGNDVTAMKRAVSRGGRWPWNPDEWDDGYANTFAGIDPPSGNVIDSGVRGVQRQHDLDASGVLGPHTFEILRTGLVPKGLPHAGEPLFDGYALELLRSYGTSGGGNVPDLGPVMKGGTTVLNHDLTHITGGLPDYPAFDDAFNAGTSIIAPEDLTVTDQSSSDPGDAFYATGKSKLKYWFGHLTGSPGNGAKFKKGAHLSYVLDHNQGGGPHVHVGIDARPLIGKPLEAHTDYTHGAATVGEQLEAAL
jgi:hypothetical protein